MAPIEELGSFWVFELEKQAWTQMKPKDVQAPYPLGRSYHTLASNGEDTIFLHAGCPEKGRLDDLWAFNIPDRRWQELAPAPAPKRGGTSIAYAEGKLYRMNGFDGKMEQGGTLDVFDLDTNHWDSISYPADGVSGPSPRSVSCLLALKVAGRQNLITLFGERDPSNLGHQGAGKMLADVWLFDIASQTWKEIHVGTDHKPQARGWFGADVLRANSGPGIVIQGGLAESNDRLDDVWVLAF